MPTWEVAWARSGERRFKTTVQGSGSARADLADRARSLISLRDLERPSAYAVFASEFVHAAGAIDDLLLAGVKRVAGGAHVDM